MKAFRKPEKPGQYFKDGKFYCFSLRSVHVMRAWPDPRSWVRTARKGWVADRKLADDFFCSRLHADQERPLDQPPTPPAMPVMPVSEAIDRVLAAFGGTVDQSEEVAVIETVKRREYAEWRHRHDILDFFEQIPEKYRNILLAYRDRRWQLLNLMARCPGVDEMHVANPAICFMLANNWVFHKPAVDKPMRAARSLICKPQRHILDWMGFAHTESIRKIMSRIRPDALSAGGLLYLRTTLEYPKVLKWLGHLPSINAGALRLISTPALHGYLSPRLLMEVAQEIDSPREPHAYFCLRDTLQMADRIGVTLPRLASYKRLRDIHDELSEQINRAYGVGVYSSNRLPLPAIFPVPPFPGCSTVIPITSLDELIKEGREMHHCVSMHAPSVAEGIFYVYRVTFPVRATAAISRNGNHWRLYEVERACNKPVTHSEREFIRDGIFGRG